MARESQKRRMGERRRLYDRRSPDERRGPERRDGERRRASASVPMDRRRHEDRRTQDRRRPVDRRQARKRRRGGRRRETPTPYSIEELELVRHRFTVPGPRASCPSCGGSFTLGRPRRRGRDIVRRVHCGSCGKAAIIANSRVARILVIEQKDVVRETVHAILASAGHEVVEAADAAVGLAAYSVSPPDVVFIDVHAAGRMEAGEFIRQLLVEDPDARIVTMAGRPSHGMVDPLAVTKGLGAVRTVRMPFSRGDVLQAVDDARA